MNATTARLRRGIRRCLCAARSAMRSRLMSCALLGRWSKWNSLVSIPRSTRSSAICPMRLCAIPTMWSIPFRSAGRTQCRRAWRRIKGGGRAARCSQSGMRCPLNQPRGALERQKSPFGARRRARQFVRRSRVPSMGPMAKAPEPQPSSSMAGFGNEGS